MTFSRWLKVAMFGAAVWVMDSNLHSGFSQNTGPMLVVQGAQLSTYSRIVVDVPSGTDYRVVHTGNKIRIFIIGQFQANVSAVSGQDLQRIGNPVVSQIGSETVVSFDVVPGVSPRDFRSGEYVILDVYGGNPTASLPSAPTVAPPVTTATNDTAVDDSGTAADETETDQTVTSGAVTAENASNNAPNVGVDSQDGSTNTSDDPEPIIELPTPEPEQEPELAANTPDANSRNITDVAMIARETNPNLELVGLEGVGLDEERVTATVTEVDNGISIAFAMPGQSASAVFERGGMLWITFDQPYKFDPIGLAEAGNLFTSRVRRVERRPHDDAFVLRMAIRPNQNFVVERDQDNWVVYLKDTSAKPRFPLKPERREEAGRGQQIFVAANDIGRKVEVEDPDIGDLIVILPMQRQGHGLAESYSYASAELLESAQGVAITPLTDFVDVERFQDGISIRSTGNDILSATRLSRATGIGDNVQTGFARLIDFENWRIGEPWEYRKNKARLYYELSLQPVGERNEVRWKLARYYLAHGRAAECLGILQRILDEDPLLVKNTEFLAVRGVANFKQGRLDAAKADLSSRELEAEQDADLWRSLVEEALGNDESALDHYRRGRDVMGTYDVYDRAEIQLAVIRAAITTNSLELAQQELGLLNGLELTERQLTELLYQNARIAEKQGQFAAAFAQYDDLSDAAQRWVAARARYSRVKFSLKNGDLDAKDAINQLERLRYAWRGDRFEAQLLDDLADLYFETAEYEQGLESLMQGVSYYPEIARDRQMQLRMGQTFKNLFLEGGAERMTPISAIGLYYKFRHLTPLGSEGDLMIRRLADRLVSVDLLSRAAELLEYQVRQRTEGAARAQIAASLAKIYILDDRPDAALEIIRATREPRLPDDIARNRDHVEARALIEQARYEEAEVMIEQDRSAEAEVLRADVFWGAKDWTRLTASIRRMLGDGWRRNEALTALQRLNLVRLTIAMTFAEDRAGLIEMRRRYNSQMVGGDFANAFELLTNDQELSGRELGMIASQIASVEKLQSFMRDYRNDFSGR